MSATMALRVKAVCSVPRLGFNDHFGSLFHTLSCFNLQPAWYTTAYWEKGIETAFEDCMPDTDVILALDYDTLCTPQHLRRLLDVMAQRPDIDALASFQARRGTGFPLLGIKGTDGEVEIDGPMQVDHAAFGMTLIRTKALESLSKPWFWAIPDPNGSTKRRDFLDPDIYFWKKWKAEGKTVYVEPSVCIGHLETMVSMYEQREIPSIDAQIDAKANELAELKKRKESGEDAKAGQLQLSQVFIRCAEWRERFGKGGSMASLGEKETK